MRLPDFFVIGAPKAGTTALYRCLKQHPDLYLSPVKETYYFATEGEPPISPGPCGNFLHESQMWKPSTYFKQFAGVSTQKAVGEGSTIYLYAAGIAAGRIRRAVPQAKIVAILRQPAERAYSSYTYWRQLGQEPARTFPEALAHEETRLKEKWFPVFCHRAQGYYHSFLSIYYGTFPREQIRIYLYEEWKHTPMAVLQDLFAFLGVDGNVTPTIPRLNVTRLPRSQWLHQLAERAGQAGAGVAGQAVRRRIAAVLRRIDTMYNLAPPPPLLPRTRALLTAVYREDILRLQDLLGRDLTHWLRES